MAVWGQMSTGGGHSQLEETMSVVRVPVMTNACFVQTERDIGELWKRELQESFVKAGREEKRLAEMRKEYHDGVPAITVIVDEDGAKSLTSTLTTPSQEWQSSVGGRSCTLVCTTNTVHPVHKTFLLKITSATGTGASHPLRWRLTLSWIGFWRRNRCTKFVI